MLNLPNVLTLIRILTIPFFIIGLAYRHYWAALIIFAIGGLTDFLDGYFARRWNQQTALGAYLDPVADKLLVNTSFIMLGILGGVPLWLTVLIVSRDILILLGFAVIYFLVDERFNARPSRIGKWSTTFQLVTLALALAVLDNPRVFTPWLLETFVWATAVATGTSGLQYLYRGFLWLQNRAPIINPPG